MMRTLILVIAAMVCSAVVQAAEPVLSPPRTISVTGTVETKAAPDYVRWSINLRDVDKDARAAKARNDEDLRKVLALRDKLKIAEGDIETGPMSIRREYERTQHGYQGEFKHFIVTRSVTVRQRDLKRFDEFLDTLVASADMEVSHSMECSQLADIRADARLEALRAAKRKAEAMAQVVGARVGRVLTINEHSPQREPWGGYASNAAIIGQRVSSDVATDRFMPGAIDVAVTVYVTFELE